MISAEKIKIADLTSSGEASKNSAKDLRRKKALKISMIKTYLSVLLLFCVGWFDFFIYSLSELSIKLTS